MTSRSPKGENKISKVVEGLEGGEEMREYDQSRNINISKTSSYYKNSNDESGMMIEGFNSDVDSNSTASSDDHSYLNPYSGHDTTENSLHSSFQHLDYPSLTSPTLSTRKNQSCVYLLGKIYEYSLLDQKQTSLLNTLLLKSNEPPQEVLNILKAFEEKLYWFTYRRNFPEIKPYKLRSDAGWGCMLRATQMLLAQTLSFHHYGHRNQKKMNTFLSPKESREKQKELSEIIGQWFADYPGPSCPFSLHNMIMCGLKYDILPGEWYGPGTACHVLKDLVSIYSSLSELSHERETAASLSGTRIKNLFKVYVCQEGCIYKDVIEEYMTQEGLIAKQSASPSPKKITTRKSQVDSNNSTATPSSFLNDPLSFFSSLQQQEEQSSTENQNDNVEEDEMMLQWDGPLLLLIPLRLGLRSFNAELYAQSLINTLSFPQTCGILGGSPRHAIYFYGANNVNTESSSGNQHILYGLDPHTVQETPNLKQTTSRLTTNQHQKVELSKEYMTSLRISLPTPPSSGVNSPPPTIGSTRLSVHKIDPSLALAFYLQDRQDFLDLCRSLKPQNQKAPIVSILETKPNYEEHLNNSSLMDSSFEEDEDHDGDDFSLDNKKSGDTKEEDDEYVFL